MVFDISRGIVAHAREYPHADQPIGQVVSLASALTASEPWRELSGRAAFVIRAEPVPSLAVIGRFDEAEEQRIRVLDRQLRDDLPSARHIDWRQVTVDVHRLATTLRDRFGPDLDALQFTAIPRGGLIVLGLLSYALRLDAARLTPAGAERAPIVIVDDVALTGLRLREMLSDVGERQTVFAHLYSTPELRRAIEEQAPWVTCVAGADLIDHSPAILGDRHHSWRRRWDERIGDRVFWVGMTDRLSFPWSEPEATFWNATTGRDEAGWRFAPPAYCMANVPSGTDAVQCQPSGKGRLRPDPLVISAVVGGEVLLGDTRTGLAYSLDGVAAAMWHAVVEHGEVATAVDQLESTFEADAEQLRIDLERFIAELVEVGAMRVYDTPG